MSETIEKNEKQTLGFEAETKQVLDLVIHSLYSNKEIFLRELVSNASDAADKLRFSALSNEELYEGDGELKVRLSVDKEARTLTISDNGIGMTVEEVKKNIGTIAHSGTKKFFESLTGDEGKDSQMIGQFGVGFYSAFMVADKVEVVSRRAGTDAAFKWESDGATGYSIEPAERDAAGTTITLHLKKADKEYASDVRLRHLVKKYSDHVAHPIKLVDDKGEMTTLNTVEALWTKAPKDISTEDYKSFYNSVGATYDDPFLTIHNKAEIGRASCRERV